MEDGARFMGSMAECAETHRFGERIEAECNGKDRFDALARIVYNRAMTGPPLHTAAEQGVKIFKRSAREAWPGPAAGQQ